MKKWTGLALMLCLLLMTSAAWADAPVISFGQKAGAIHCGAAYSLTLKADAAVQQETNVTVHCPSLKQTLTAVLPAGASETVLSVDIPSDRGGEKLSFSLVSGTGYTAGQGQHSLQVYSLPKVTFYTPYMVDHLNFEPTVLVSCSNPRTVYSDELVFELRNSQGMVLDTMTWSNPSKQGRFAFTVTEELLGKQILSVWVGDQCVTAENGYIFLSDFNVSRLTTLKPLDIKGAMSITIDCGSPSNKTPEQTTAILAVLEKYDVKATFFMTGQFVQSQTESALRIRDAGHEIANHSYSHPRIPELEGYRKMHNEIMRCTRLIEERLGVTPRLYRPPYGDTNEKVTALARGEGMEEVMWTVDSYDWHEGYTHSMVLERVTNSKVVNGAIILFHLDGFNTPETLDQVIPYYQDELGLRCMPVTELMAHAGRELPPMPDDREALVYAADNP